MKNDPVIVYRVDGGSRLGMGHLHKARSLLHELRKKFAGAEFICFVKKDHAGLKWLKKSIKFAAVVSIPERVKRSEEPSWLLKHLPRARQGIMILDILDVSSSYVRALKRGGFSVVTFENKNRSIQDADATFNSLVSGLENKVIRRSGKGILYQGPAYRILDSSFRRMSRRLHARRCAETLLVASGGGDEGGFVSLLLDELAKQKPSISVYVACGPAQKSKIKAYGKYTNMSVRILPPQKTLAPWMAKADLSVTAGGGTLYELAYMGVPAIAFAKRKHQLFNIQKFSEKGTVLLSGTMNRRAASRAAALVTRLLTTPGQRKSMSSCGLRLVDGKGIARVTAVIQKLLNH